MKRTLFIGLIGVLLLAVAGWLSWQSTREEAARSPAAAPQAAAPPAGNGSAPAPAPPPPAQPAPAGRGQPVQPSFDVVRINPSGDAVIAGRAAPNAEVTVRDGEREIGRVTADPRGEWVLVPSEALPPGQRRLNLAARNPEGGSVASPDEVILVVPEPDRDVAGRPSGQTAPPLALLVPNARSGEGQSTPQALQVPPTGGPTPVAPAPSAPQGPARTGATPTAPAPSAPGGAAGPAAPAPGAAGPQIAALPPPLPKAPGPPTEAPRRALSLDVVDYGASGQLSLSGRAEPHARVLLYLDNRPVGQAEADENGRWSMQLGESVPPGNYTLRLDDVRPDGRVVARVELPFQRAEPPSELPGKDAVVVQPGNSLWRLARRTYGSGVRYSVIYEANRAQIVDPDLIYPGQIFKLPAAN